jgi:hypothetical protein
MTAMALAFTASRSGSVHLPSAPRMPSGRPACGAGVPHIMPIMATGARNRGKNDMAQSAERHTRVMPHPLKAAKITAKCGNVEAARVSRGFGQKVVFN